MATKTYDYEQQADGRYVLTMFGQAGHNATRFATEAEVQQALADWIKDSADADRDERRFNVQ